MASFARRTTLADERRALRAQCQQRTAPRFHEETYDSSSDEEDPEPFHNDRPVPNATTAASRDYDNNNGIKDDTKKEQDKAKLEEEYAKADKKRPRRTKATLKAPLLVDPETGLSRLLHRQPKLAKADSVTAAASYTRKLFAHYHTAVRDWTYGSAQPTDTQWMHQMERLSSQKVVRDHVESLRKVVCRHYVESKVGLEKADRYFEQLATEAAAMEPEEQGMAEDPESPTRGENAAETHATGQPARVSPPQPSRETDQPDDGPEEAEEFEMDDASNKRPLPGTTAEEETAPVSSKRRVLEEEESEDEELEFTDKADNEPDQTSTKRRVLDDGSDDEEAELEFGNTESSEVKEAAPDGPTQNNDAKDTRPTASGAPSPSESNTRAVETTEDHAEDARNDTQMQTETAGNENEDMDTDIVTTKQSAEQDAASNNSDAESPSNKSGERLHVYEDSPGQSPGSSAAVNVMALGQPSQQMTTQSSQEEALFDTFMTQTASQGSPQSETEQTEEAVDTSPSNPSPGGANDTAAEHGEEAPTQVMGASPSEQATLVPTYYSAQEDDTVVPSLSETQTTLVPSPTQEE